MTEGLQDINDVFDNIVMSENRIFEQGQKDGLQMAERSSYELGRKMGIDKGCELAQEVGFYWGFTAQLKVLSDKLDASQRALKLMEQLERMLDEFCSSEKCHVLTDDAFSCNIDSIRNKFKQLMSLLKLDVSYQQTGGLSF